MQPPGALKVAVINIHIGRMIRPVASIAETSQTFRDMHIMLVSTSSKATRRRS